jgi:hypothetical protein
MPEVVDRRGPSRRPTLPSLPSLAAVKPPVETPNPKTRPSLSVKTKSRPKLQKKPKSKPPPPVPVDPLAGLESDMSLPVEERRRRKKMRRNVRKRGVNLTAWTEGIAKVQELNAELRQMRRKRRDTRCEPDDDDDEESW